MKRTEALIEATQHLVEDKIETGMYGKPNRWLEKVELVGTSANARSN